MTDAAGIYSQSDSSEGPILRDFVDEALAQNSLRSELLSRSATNGATTPGSTERSFRPRRGPSKRYRAERELAYRGKGTRELLGLLIENEYDASKINKTLSLVLAQKEAEAQRAAEAERQVKVLSDSFQRMNENKVAAERESQTLEEELTLYKIQYDLAQKEILKARDTVLALQTQLDAAEQVARKARGEARKVQEALEIWKAREEGRKQGYEAGWNRAREEFGIVKSQPNYELEYPDIGTRATDDADEDTISYRTYPPPRSLIQFPEVPVVPGPAGSSRPPPDHIPQSILRRTPEPEPLLPSRPPSTRFGMATPAVQTYDIPIPPPDQVEFDNRPPSPVRRANSRKQQQSRREPPQPPIQLQRSPSPRPPDNYIPALSDDGHIALPPPHELAEYLPSPQPSVVALPAQNDLGPRRVYTSSKGKDRATDSWYNQSGEVDSRTHIPSNDQPAQASTSASWYQQTEGSNRSRRASLSSRYSANSSVFLDAWGVPIQDEPKRSGGLGNTLKNMFRGGGKSRQDSRALSMIKENPLSRQGSLNVGPAPSSAPPVYNDYHPPNDPDQRYAPEQRYDGTVNNQSTRPPRNVRMPAQIIMPQLLSSPQQQQQQQNPPGHNRAMSMGSNTSSGFYGGVQRGTAVTEGPGRRANSRRETLISRPLDLSSPPVSISVQPPSQSPSEAPAGLNSATRHGPGTPAEYLSPNNAPAQLADPVRPRSTSLNQGSHSRPMDAPDWASRAVSPGLSDRSRGPSRAKTLNSQAQAYTSRSASAASTNQRNSPYLSQTNLPDREGSTNSFRDQRLAGHRRSESAGVTGSPHSFRNEPLPNPHMRATSEEGGAGPSPLKRVTSNISVKSMGSQYSHYDPDTYRDPAHFALDTDPNYQPRSESRTSRR